MSIGLFGKIWSAFNAHNVPRLAAALAFSIIFSVAPLFVVLITLAGYALAVSHVGAAHELVENALLQPITSSAGEATAQAIRDLVASAFNKPHAGVVAQIFAWGAFVAGAIGLFSALQDALNTIFGAQPSGGWKRVVRARLGSFGMILAAGLILSVSLAGNAALSLVGAEVFRGIPFGGLIPRIAGELLSLALSTLCFTLVYKLLPDTPIAWRYAWAGGAITAVLFAIGEVAISVYLGIAAVGSAYGAAGALLVGLLWIYYSSIVILVGAEITNEIALSKRQVGG